MSSANDWAVAWLMLCRSKARYRFSKPSRFAPPRKNLGHPLERTACCPHAAVSMRYSSTRSSARPPLWLTLKDVPGVNDTKLTLRRCRSAITFGSNVSRSAWSTWSPPTLSRRRFCLAICALEVPRHGAHKRFEQGEVDRVGRVGLEPAVLAGALSEEGGIGGVAQQEDQIAEHVGPVGQHLAQGVVPTSGNVAGQESTVSVPMCSCRGRTPRGLSYLPGMLRR